MVRKRWLTLVVWAATVSLALLVFGSTVQAADKTIKWKAQSAWHRGRRS